LRITNEDIIANLGAYNKDVPAELLSKCQRELTYLLNKTGAATRYIRDRARGETAISLLKDVTHDAIERAGLGEDEIDLLIYCGVGRGFLEPAMAYFCAEAVGLECPCFDILDACMSWVRALEVASMYLAGGACRHILIVNAEFTAYECGYPNVFKIRSIDDLAHLFPAFTIGEAATATVVTRSEDNWSFRFMSRPQMASLCHIPLEGYQDFCEPNEHVGVNGINRFVSFAGKLFDAAIAGMVRLIQESVLDVHEPDIWFPHSAASRPYSRIAESLGIEPQKVYVSTFSEYGNLVSASIPAAMHRAIGEGVLERGHQVVLCPASAGMALAVVQFTF
jgi:3-oxoacyl-[acyl-carrier-protein] synthase III